jgi:hypothetical protein
MRIDWTLTADAVATLIAGVVAFVAVIVQIRSSSNSVSAQIEAEKKAQWEEESRRRQAVARALLFEVVNFYRYYQKQIRSQLDAGKSLGVQVPTLSAPAVGSFAVYHGNAGKLGDFDSATVESVVSFYVAAQWFVSTIESYQTNLYRELELYTSLQPASAPVTLLARLRDDMPHLEQAALTACRNLCKVAAIEYDSLELTR